MISKKLLTVATISWLCIEIGQFVEIHTSLGQNRLYWPFWFAVTLIIILGTHIIDIYIEKFKGKPPAQDQQARQSNS